MQPVVPCPKDAPVGGLRATYARTSARRRAHWHLRGGSWQRRDISVMRPGAAWRRPASAHSRVLTGRLRVGAHCSPARAPDAAAGQPRAHAAGRPRRLRRTSGPKAPANMRAGLAQSRLPIPRFTGPGPICRESGPVPGGRRFQVTWTAGAPPAVSAPVCIGPARGY